MMFLPRALLPAGLLILFTGATAAAENTTVPPAQNQSETTIEKNVKLEIRDQQITEKDYSASNAVSLEGRQNRGLNVKIGSSVRATEVNIVLHNIFGQVYFKGSLEPLLKIIREKEPNKQISQ
jgi:hypothetical protein